MNAPLEELDAHSFAWRRAHAVYGTATTPLTTSANSTAAPTSFTLGSTAAAIASATAG